MDTLHKRLLATGGVVLLVLSVFMFTGCGNDDDATVTPVPAQSNFISAELIESLSFDDVIKNAGETDETGPLHRKRQEIVQRMWTEMNAKAKTTAGLKLKKTNGTNVTLHSESEFKNFCDTNNLKIDALCPYVDTFKVKYSTTSANGETITASARVLINYGTAFFVTWYAVTDAILLHCHATQMENSKTPTSQSGFGASECGLLYGEAWSDIMVDSPDYEGYGETKDRVHPYLIQDITAQQCWDAARAAKKWKDDNYGGCEDDFYTVAAGFSQGGSVALATQKYVQNSFTDNGLNFIGSLCGDGPYDPFATYSRYAKDDYGLYLPSVLTLILRAYLYYYKDTLLQGFTVENYLKPEVIAKLKENDPDGKGNVWGMIDSKTKSTSDVDGVIKDAVGKKDNDNILVSDMLTAEAINPESKAYKALKSALDLNNLTDPGKWSGAKNDKTIGVMHWGNDEAVPYENLKSLKNSLTVKDKSWSEDDQSKIYALIDFLDTFGISDSLDDVKLLFTHPDVHAGAHIAAGKLYFLGNIFWRGDYKRNNL